MRVSYPNVFLSVTICCCHTHSSKYFGVMIKPAAPHSTTKSNYSFFLLIFINLIRKTNTQMVTMTEHLHYYIKGFAVGYFQNDCIINRPIQLNKQPGNKNSCFCRNLIDGANLKLNKTNISRNPWQWPEALNIFLFWNELLESIWP